MGNNRRKTIGGKTIGGKTIGGKTLAEKQTCRRGLELRSRLRCVTNNSFEEPGFYFPDRFCSENFADGHGFRAGYFSFAPCRLARPVRKF